MYVLLPFVDLAAQLLNVESEACVEIILLELPDLLDSIISPVS